MTDQGTWGVVATAASASPIALATSANADVTNNGTTRDAQGYCIANHLHNGWSEDNPFNGTENGIGHLRSKQTGAAISGSAGNRVPTEHCVTPQGVWGPISNNG